MYRKSALELSSLFKKGDLSAEEIAASTFRRIEACDRQIGAFLSLFEKRALERAKKLDEKRKRGAPLGKLAAVPIALKDNMHLKGELTTCASRFLSNYRAVFDATVSRLLEEEDALIIGKTNLDEFAMGSSTENSAYHVTKNPWDLNTVPGGSSGGSAAAVAARLCPIALGSDTGGSIRQPASLCGIVGFKPTYGRVSRYGLVAFASSLDQIGPLTGSVAETTLIMEVIGKHCPHDSTSFDLPQESYLEKLEGSLKGKKIGVYSKLLTDLPREAQKQFQHSLDLFKSEGASVVEVDLDLSQHALSIYYILATAEASTNLARFDGIRYGRRSPRAKTLSEVYDYSKQEGFGEEVKNRILLGTYVLSSGYRDAYYIHAQKVRSLMIQQFRQAFTACDIIATPTTPLPAFPIGSIQDPLQMYLQDIFTIPANLAGLPAISLPCGLNEENKPLGLQLIGPQLGDAAVLSCAHLFEKASGFKRKIPPLFDKEIPA
jgi:aspartyl-tRNA(Asn)/glutamyl-tRNA(Gln) amidotransferase subunit A